MSGSLTFGSFAAADFGMKIGSVQVYGGAGNAVNALRVPGRMGQVLAIDDVAEVDNDLREYNAGLYMKNATPSEVALRIAKIRKWLLDVQGYSVLKDSYEPGFYRRAYFQGDVNFTRKGAGQNFETALRFSCDPRRFIDGVPDVVMRGQGGVFDAEITPPEAWANLIVYPAKPLIKIEGEYANDNFDLIFTDVTGTEERGKISFAEDIGTLYFDTETLNATSAPYGGANLNSWITDVSGDVSLRGLVDYVHRTTVDARITITPRWWVR
jgi:hypothetical protein